MATYERKINQTKTAIVDAVISLLENKKIDDITIKDIIEIAKISRGTFYRYYYDKYEVVEQLESRMLDHLETMHEKAIQDNKNWRVDQDFNTRFLFDIIVYIGNERRLFGLLLGDNVDLPFQERLVQKFVAIERDGLEFLYKHSLNQDQIFYVQYTAAAVVGIVKYWLREQPELEAQTIYQFVSNVGKTNLTKLISDDN